MHEFKSMQEMHTAASTQRCQSPGDELRKKTEADLSERKSRVSNAEGLGIRFTMSYVLAN